MRYLLYLIIANLTMFAGGTSQPLSYANPIRSDAVKAGKHHPKRHYRNMRFEIENDIRRTQKPDHSKTRKIWKSDRISTEISRLNGIDQDKNILSRLQGLQNWNRTREKNENPVLKSVLSSIGLPTSLEMVTADLKCSISCRVDLNPGALLCKDPIIINSVLLKVQMLI